MNEEQNNPEAQNFSGTEMKMPENSTPQSTVPPVVKQESSSSILNGPILVGIAAVLIAILAGMYLWLATMSSNDSEVQPAPIRPTTEQNNEPESTTAEAQTDTMLVTSPSDEMAAIEADIEATNLDSLDAEMAAIEAELDAAAEAE